MESEPHQTPQSTEKPALRTRPVEPKTVRRGLLHRLQQVVNPEERAGSKSGEYKSRTERVGMKTLAIAASLILALTATPSLAETSIHAGGFSYHVATGHKVDYNSNHKLLAVEHNGLLVGRFSNSYNRTTAIAAYGWSKQWGNWRGAVYVGAMRGYRSCYGDDGDKAVVCPVAFPSLHYTAWRVQPGVLVLGEAVALTVRLAL